MLFIIAVCVGLAFLCWFALMTMTFFPEEIAASPSKQKYFFMANHVYKSDLGLFYPAYMSYSYLMLFSFSLLTVVFTIAGIVLQLVKAGSSLFNRS
jgi:hypothetical protein